MAIVSGVPWDTNQFTWTVPKSFQSFCAATGFSCDDTVHLAEEAAAEPLDHSMDDDRRDYSRPAACGEAHTLSVILVGFDIPVTGWARTYLLTPFSPLFAAALVFDVGSLTTVVSLASFADEAKTSSVGWRRHRRCDKTTLPFQEHYDGHG